MKCSLCCNDVFCPQILYFRTFSSNVERSSFKHSDGARMLKASKKKYTTVFSICAWCGVVNLMAASGHQNALNATLCMQVLQAPKNILLMGVILRHF